MRALSYRFPIFSNHHTTQFIQDPKGFRLVMGKRVKVQSIWLNDFTFSSIVAIIFTYSQVLFNIFHLRTKTFTFNSLYFESLFIPLSSVFHFHVSKFFDHIDYFNKQGFLLLATNLKVYSHFIFLCLSFVFLSSLLYTPLGWIFKHYNASIRFLVRMWGQFGSRDFSLDLSTNDLG